MSNVNTEKFVEFLESYFRVHGAMLVASNVLPYGIEGAISWPDEVDTQDILWSVSFDDPPASCAVDLCDYLVRNSLVNGDVVVLSDDDLLEQLETLGWSLEVAQEAIDYVYSVEVSMVDDGIVTDSFFLHQ